MTRKGAQIVIESMSLRIAEIEELKDRLTKEEERLQARILELEQVQDPIPGTPIIAVNQ